MDTITTTARMQRVALRARADGKRIGLVPTMGYLHEGHLSLVRRARPLCDLVVVSIFVNPAQFGPGEDLSRYPRDPERDAALCREEGVDILYMPSPDDVYPPGYSTYVVEESLSLPLCGRDRPGHFRGVATVVAKLFNIVQPTVAVFGRKDAQQLRLIERLARDLNFPVEIVGAPIVREPDGLAMSSRNAYLAEGERERARCLRHALDEAERLYAGGERDAAAVAAAMRRLVETGTPPVHIDYIEIVDYDTLRPVERMAGPTLVALAVRVGRTRLIDNTILAASPTSA